MKRIALLSGILLILSTLFLSSAIPCQAYSQISANYTNPIASGHTAIGGCINGNGNWAGQIFQAISDNPITAIALRLGLAGTIGNSQIDIYAVSLTSGNYTFTGPSLDNIQVPSTLISATPSYVQLPLATPIESISNTLYCIVMTGVGTWGDGQNCIYWYGNDNGDYNMNLLTGGGYIGTNYSSTTIVGKPFNLYFETFTDYIASATVQTLKANQTSNDLILSGRITSFGADPTVQSYFNWGTDTNYGNLATGPILTYSKGNGQNFTASIPINEFTPGTIIHYQAFCEGTTNLYSAYGTDYTYTILSAASSTQRLETDKATNISYNTVTLNGQLFSLGNDTSVNLTFSYGTSPDISSSATVQTGATQLGAYSVTLTGLSENTEYYYQFRSTGNLDGMENNNNQILTFKTHSSSSSPLVNGINDWLDQTGIGATGTWLLLLLICLICWIPYLLKGREKIWMVAAVVLNLITIGAFIAMGLLSIWLVVLLIFSAGITIFGFVFKSSRAGN